MRLLADECVAGSLVKELRRLNIDVEWISETASGSTDREVLDHSIRSNRLLLTEDYDFADLIFRFGQRAVGIVIMSASFTAKPANEVAAAVVKRLSKPETGFRGVLTILEPDKTRQRTFPA